MTKTAAVRGGVVTKSSSVRGVFYALSQRLHTIPTRQEKTSNPATAKLKVDSRVSVIRGLYTPVAQSTDTFFNPEFTGQH